MPIMCSCHDNVLRAELVGRYTFAEIQDAFSGAMADPAHRGIDAMFLDETGSESLKERKPADLREIAKFIGRASMGRIRRCAVLVDSDAKYGICRMSQAYCGFEGLEMGVFKDRAEALIWLSEGQAGCDGMTVNGER